MRAVLVYEKLSELICSGNLEEAMSALQVLGYSQGEVAGVLATLDPSLSSSELIRLSLLQLGKNMFK